MTDQEKAIKALKAEFAHNGPELEDGAYFAREVHAAIDRAVSISRASQGSQTDEMVCVPVYDPDAERPNVIGPDERAAIRARASRGSAAGEEDRLRVARALFDLREDDEANWGSAGCREFHLVEADAAIAALSPPAEQGSRVKLESDLADLVRHCWVRSAYRNCGYDQMDTAQKQLYDAIISTDPDEATLSPPAAEASFQARVAPWMLACFGAEISGDMVERGDRLLEEVLELLQSGGYDPARVAPLRDYVYGRPVGDPAQEAGGVEVTMAAYCLAAGIDKHQAGETELARIWTKVEKIREKQAAKPRHSPLPIALSPPATPQGASAGWLARYPGGDPYEVKFCPTREAAWISIGASRACDAEELRKAGWTMEPVAIVPATSANRAATPQAPEDDAEAKRADETLDVVAALYKAWPDAEDIASDWPLGIIGSIEQIIAERNDARKALERAHLLATPVTVTMEECAMIWRSINTRLRDTFKPQEGCVAEALRRVLPGRIQIAGSEGPK